MGEKYSQYNTAAKINFSYLSGYIKFIFKSSVLGGNNTL